MLIKSTSQETLTVTIIPKTTDTWHTGIPRSWMQELDAALWTLHSGRWILEAGFWKLDPGCWTLDAGL